MNYREMCPEVLGVYTVQHRHLVSKEFAANPKYKCTVISATKHHRIHKVRCERTPSKINAK